MAGAFQSVFREGLFAGQAGIVTGAGSGIGRCTAHELAALGARVALIGRKAEKLEAVAREIADAGGSARCYTADIREEERVQEVVRAVLADHGRLDFLVNNAGGQFGSPLEKISAKGWDAVVRTNLTGGFLMAREAYTQWMKSERRRDREHDRRHVERHARHGPFGRGARRHAQFHRDRRARMGAGARERGRARLDRVVRPRSLSARDARAYPRPAEESAARAARHRVGNFRRDRVSALARRRVHFRLVHPHRRRACRT